MSSKTPGGCEGMRKLISVPGKEPRTHSFGKNLHMALYTAQLGRLSLLGGFQTKTRNTGTAHIDRNMLRGCFKDPCGLHKQMLLETERTSARSSVS